MNCIWERTLDLQNHLRQYPNNFPSLQHGRVLILTLTPECLGSPRQLCLKHLVTIDHPTPKRPVIHRAPAPQNDQLSILIAPHPVQLNSTSVSDRQRLKRLPCVIGITLQDRDRRSIIRTTAREIPIHLSETASHTGHRSCPVPHSMLKAGRIARPDILFDPHHQPLSAFRAISRHTRHRSGMSESALFSLCIIPRISRRHASTSSGVCQPSATHRPVTAAKSWTNCRTTRSCAGATRTRPLKTQSPLRPPHTALPAAAAPSAGTPAFVQTPAPGNAGIDPAGSAAPEHPPPELAHPPQPAKPVPRWSLPWRFRHNAPAADPAHHADFAPALRA